MRILTALILGLVFGALAAGCGTSKTPETGSTDMAALGSKSQDGHIIERYDLSGDGKADLWKVYREVPKADADKDAPASTERLLVRKEMDLNFDGKVDIRQFVNADGTLAREEMDLDFDGHTDAVALYNDGQLVKRELDLNFDGKADVFKYYEDGKLVRKERANGRSGKVNIWEYYEAGRLVRIGRDRDGDGKPEVFDDAPEPEPELPKPATDGSTDS